MQALQARLRRVRVCCGDWKRVLGRSPTECIGLTGVFLDPPYSDAAGRDGRIYSHDDLTIAHAVREWAIEHGDNPKLRIALCGYEGEHEMPASWQCVAWKANGGYASSAGNHENAQRERIWFSPACLPYRPSKKRVRACGEVLGELPLPEQEEAGELHRLPKLSWLNWVRLALIPAGGDWRDLPGMHEGGRIGSRRARRPRARRTGSRGSTA
jgi:hypothetical protein